MPHIIQLPIRTFGLVKASSRFVEPNAVRTRAVQQITNLNVVKPADPTELARIMIEYGAVLSHYRMHDAEFDGTNLFKQFRNKKFILQVDEMHVDEQGSLHRDEAPAFVSGEDKFYFLHGLQLNEDQLKFIQTPPEQLDAQEILSITNVDLRREMIRKKGIEQLLDGLFHRTIDKYENYSLIQVMLGDNQWTACNFLKMLNPSIGVWHMEGVPNNIRTVRDALLWRNNGWFDHAEDIT